MPDATTTTVHSFADRETFMVDLLAHLGDVMRDAIGPEEIENLISAVSYRMARDVMAENRGETGGGRTAQEAAAMLVRLKSQIGGAFDISRQDDSSVEFRGCGCPFGERVKGRSALCQMTAGIFGRVMADTAGYARVTVAESIARGHDGCKVIVELKRPEAALPAADHTTEFFPTPPQAR